MTLALSIINFLFCFIRLLFSFKNNRLISIQWFLIAYFSFHFIFVVNDGEFYHFRNFINDSQKITIQTIRFCTYYILSFNLLFFLSETIIFSFVKNKIKLNFYLPKYNSNINKQVIVFIIILLFSAASYYNTISSHNYRDYVEYQGSNWALAFIWTSSPVISILAMQKKYILAILCCVPFILFSVKLNIRSFALLSIIPLAFTYVMQLKNNTRSTLSFLNKYLKIILIFCFLLFLSYAIVYDKNDKFKLPDSGMPYGVPITIELSEKFNVKTNWNSLNLYFLNILKPFYKILAQTPKKEKDTPVIIANMIEGVPLNWDVYYHYPTLWYSDTFISFGIYGVIISIFWGTIFSLWEYICLRNTLLLSLFLPFYCWHAYMVVRGATAIAAVPFSYAVYLTFIITFLFNFKLISKNNYGKNNSFYK